jgi:hypothetical protein
MEAGNYKNAVGLHLVKKAVGKAMHTCPPSLPVDNGEAQRRACYELNRTFNRLNEPLSQRHAYICIP